MKERTLEEKSALYCGYKEEEKSLNKNIKALNEDIKKTMDAANVKVVTTEDYIVTLESRTKDDIDPALMLMVLKKYWDKEHKGEPCPFIRTIEVLDEDELEKFMYSTKLPAETVSALDKCRTTTVTQALTYKKVKGK